MLYQDRAHVPELHKMWQRKNANVALNVFQQVKKNVLLQRKACVQQNKRYVFLDIIKSPPQKQNKLEIKDDIQTTKKEKVLAAKQKKLKINGQQLTTKL